VNRRFDSAWEYFARTNAFGAILTAEDGALRAWDAQPFFAAGKADADRFVADVRAIAPAVPLSAALDFGCGVGRVTQGLADHFQRVVGVDVAETMIERARALNQNPRCSFVVNRSARLAAFPDRSFTVVYSRLVLQHIRPALVRRYVPELVRVLAPGGVVMFQLPDVIRSVANSIQPKTFTRKLKRRLPWPVVVAWREMHYRSFGGLRTPEMQMYGMAPEEVLTLLQEAGARLLDVRPDTSHGCSQAAGFEYWATR
jgi:ubiquinone/menaquinone biosynthesis C-methylase UbiE